MELTYPRGINMEEIFKEEENKYLTERITRLEEENKKISLQFQKIEKLNESTQRTLHCVVFAAIIVVSIIPAGRDIALITSTLLLIPAVLVSYIFR
jgi:hypothetical protein